MTKITLYFVKHKFDPDENYFGATLEDIQEHEDITMDSRARYEPVKVEHFCSISQLARFVTELADPIKYGDDT